MKEILFFFLRLVRFFHRVRRMISGRTESDIHNHRIVTGRAWDEFCDRLKLAGAALHHHSAPHDPFNQAEGIRYLTRLTRGGLEAFIEYGDPAFPVLRRTAHETIKLGADNPDNFYFNAQISGEYEYRIRGKRNTVHYLGFFTQNGNYGTTGGLSPCGALEHTAMTFESDGSFEIILSREPRGLNWLKTDAQTSLVMVRQTFLDRYREVAAEVTIENLDGRKHPKPVTPALIDEGLQTASLFVGGAATLFARWAQGFQRHPNTLPLFDPETSNKAGGDASILYYHSYWKLTPEEALVITVKPPDCDSWNFQLNNYWMESLDYRYFTICINKASAVYEADGSVRVVVARRDPGIPNWIDTCGHDEGTMLWRWYRVKEDVTAPQPSCRVVKMEEFPEINHE